MSEPTTPTGKRLSAILATWSDTDDILAIEQEAHAMTLHEACEAEWKRRDAAHPGIDQSLHDWRAHLEAPTDG